MADQQAKDNKTRLVLILLLVIAVGGLVGYLVLGNNDSDSSQTAVTATPADDSTTADEGANAETDQAGQAETDPTLVEAQAIIDELKAIDQNFQAAGETCDLAAIDSTKLAGQEILARHKALTASVTDPTPAYNDLLDQINIQLVTNGTTEIGLLAQCPGLLQS